MPPLYAILLDGGFLTKKLHGRSKTHPTADDIVAECDRLRRLPEIGGYELLRIYYYDAPPSSRAISQPVSKKPLKLAQTERFRQSQSLYDQLVLKPHFALRMGETQVSQFAWRVKPSTVKELIATPRPLSDDDFQLDIKQKGVDMRIGLDIARLSLRETVRAIIVVTGDGDFVPAFKFARREGVKIILDPMGHNISNELKSHSDLVVPQAQVE